MSDSIAAGLLRLVGWLVGCTCVPATAATLAVSVADGEGQALDRVVVYALPANATPPVAATGAGAAAPAMDQQNNTFVPHILVVQKGSSVVFPNHDSVSHHVYSFSPAKSFELGLYKGNTHAPVLFDQDGLVVLGCNIHDGMLGYILVVDTPHFALTDESGSVTLNGLPEGAYTVRVWTPRAREKQLPAAAPIDLTATPRAALEFKIGGKLLPDHDHSTTGLSWTRY